MTCRTIVSHGVTAIVCSRDRNVGLLCDGCDEKLPLSEGVSPRAGLDFCARCFAPAWKRWLSAVSVQGVPSTENRALRRVQFRAWARANADEFLSLVVLSPAARKAAGL